MNPWITERVAEAHRQELRRVAEAGHWAERPRHVRPGTARPLVAARLGIGTALIRAGTRVGGSQLRPVVNC